LGYSTSVLSTGTHSWWH